jgi:hypothetical protein
VTPTLAWGSAAGTTQYTYCIDTSNDNTCAGNWILTGTSTSAVLHGLLPNTSYYWQVEANVGGSWVQADSGAWWSFTTATWSKLTPASGSAGVALNPTLSWQPAPGSDSYTYAYCIDTSNDSTCAGNWMSTGTSTSANPTGLLPNTPYYWQVYYSDSGYGTRYANGGTWWSFTTGGPVPVTVTFKSVAANDGWVLESSETSVAGGTLNSTATTCRVGDDAADRQYRSILDFNTGSLPDNAVITGVALRIKSSSVVGTSPFGTHGLLIADVRRGAFNGNLALETADFQAAASKSTAGTFGAVPVSGWYRSDLLASAYSKVNVKGRTQFRLRFGTDDNDDMSADYLAFLCGNAAAASRPQLIITYYLP